jgi:hypothetical protein
MFLPNRCSSLGGAWLSSSLGNFGGVAAPRFDLGTKRDTLRQPVRQMFAAPEPELYEGVSEQSIKKRGGKLTTNNDAEKYSTVFMADFSPLVLVAVPRPSRHRVSCLRHGVFCGLRLEFSEQLALTRC